MISSRRPSTHSNNSISSTLLSPSFLFFIASILLLTVQISSFFILSGVNYLNLHSNIFLGLTDAMLLLSPYLFLTPKWRWAIVVPMVIIPIFLYANLLYIRNFGDLMSFTMMTGTQNATNMIWSGVIASMKPADLWIGIPLIIFISALILTRSVIRRDKFTLRFKIITFAICILSFIAQQLFLLHVFHLDFERRVQVDPAVTNEKFHYRKLKYMERYVNLRYYGLIPYLSLETYKYLKPKYHTISAEETESITSFMNRPAGVPIISTPDSNQYKNAILIIVESLNSSVLNSKVNGKPALPYLSSLLGDSAVIAATRMLPQVGIGRSSDGQFMYQTGLLPLKNEALAMIYPSADYPSLSKALKREGREFNPGPPSQWNHIPLSQSFGNIFYGGADAAPIPEKSLDAYIFNRALAELPSHQPFLEIICTVDSHDPYVDYDGLRTDIWGDASYLENEKIYIEKLRQFDRALEQFIKALKKRNLFEDTVIFIVSDHNARESTLAGSKTLNTGYIPFIVLNSGINLRTDSEIGQIDIFPTILDVMGVLDRSSWKGFGTSLLRNPSIAISGKHRAKIPDPFNYPTPESWQASESIVTGGYYK